MTVPKFEEAIQRLRYQAEIGGWYKEDSTVPVRIGDLYSTFGKLKELQVAAELSLKAEARIEELEEMLKWYIEEDEINEGDHENQYWLDGKHKAMKLLGMEIEE